MKRYDPIPLVQRGGSQPYSTQGGRHPGAALLAMLQGSTAGGINPMDSWRQMQKSEIDPNTVLAQLASSRNNVTPGGKRGSGDWMLTPDQRDRNTEHSLRRLGLRRIPIPLRDVRNI